MFFTLKWKPGCPLIWQQTFSLTLEWNVFWSKACKSGQGNEKFDWANRRSCAIWLLFYIFETQSLPALRNKCHSAYPASCCNLLLERLPSVVLVDAGISRSGSGALLLTQVHPKYFLSPLPFKNAMTKQLFLNINSNIHGITLTSSTAGRVSGHHHLHFAGMKSNSSHKTHLPALHFLPNNTGSHTWAKCFWR